MARFVRVVLVTCLALVAQPSSAGSGTVRVSCPNNPNDGDGCEASILTSGGGARNFVLKEGETVRVTANKDDRFCVIASTAPPAKSCKWEKAKEVVDYSD